MMEDEDAQLADDLADDVDDSRANPAKRKAAALDDDLLEEEQASQSRLLNAGSGSGGQRLSMENAEDGSGGEGGPDEEEEEDEGPRRKKKQRLRRNRFIDDVADVDDDEEDNDEEDDDEGTAAGDRFIEEDSNEVPRLTDHLSFRKRDVEEGRYDAVDEEAINARYRKMELDSLVTGDDEDAMDQHSLLPSATDDPKLWMVKCQAGMEKEIVGRLMAKYLVLKHSGTPLAIYSAFCQEIPSTLLGSRRESHFYIEARSEKAVAEAVAGLRAVLRSKPIVRVPHAEMTEALTPRDTTRKDLRPGTWARVVGGGLYKGDLCRIVSVDADSMVTIQAVPRIDFTALKARARDRARGIPAEPFGGRRGAAAAAAVRPPPAAFNPEAAREAGQIVESRRSAEHSYVMNGKVFTDGYEVRRISVRSVVAEGDPPMGDVQRFLNAAVGADSGEQDRLLLATASSTAGKFAVGDRVEVTLGDLKGMKGVIVELDKASGSAVVEPRGLKGFNERLDFRLEDLRKSIEVGVRVKVIAGASHVGDLGIVTAVDDKLASVVLDDSDATATFPVSALTQTAETASRQRELGPYQLHQLLLCADGTVGMLVRISAQAGQLLIPGGDSGGILRAVRVPQVKRALDNRRVPAPDFARQRIVATALVEILEGAHKGRSGAVVHVNKPYLWIHCRDVSENNGHVVVRSEKTRVKGAPGGGGALAANGALFPRSPAVGLGGRSPAYPGAGAGAGGVGLPAGLQSPQHGDGLQAANGVLGGGGGRFGGYGGGRGRGRGPRDTMVTKRVKVLRGQYRGYVGTVEFATDTHVKVALDAAPKSISLRRDAVMLDDGRGAARVALARRAGGGGAAGVLLAPRTPAHMSAKTPAYTPAYDLGAEDAPYEPASAPTPGTAPFTPGSAPVATPAAATPGTLPPGAAPAMTPGTFGAATPGTGNVAATPGSHAGPTPAGTTPGSAVAAGGTNRAFHLYVGIQVLHGGAQHVVQAYDAATGEATVAAGSERDDGSLAVDASAPPRRVAAAALEIVAPARAERVRVVAAPVGSDAEALMGVEGTLVGQDDDDWIFRIGDDPNTGEVKIVDMGCLAKLDRPRA